MSSAEMRAQVAECERLADSLALTPDDLRKTLREIAAQWRRLADDGKTHPTSPTSPLDECSGFCRVGSLHRSLAIFVTIQDGGVVQDPTGERER